MLFASDEGIAPSPRGRARHRPPRSGAFAALWRVAVASTSLVACEAEPPSPPPDEVAQTAQWTITAPQISVSAGETLLVGHPVHVATMMNTTMMNTTTGTQHAHGRLEILLRSAERGAECLLSRTTWTGATVSSESIVPASCMPLVGALDLRAVAQFAPMANADGSVEEVAIAPSSTACLVGIDTGCRPLRLAPNPGADVRLDGLQLDSSVAVLEFAGPPMPATEAAPAFGAPGEVGYIPTKAAVDPALFAPALGESPALAGQATVWTAGNDEALAAVLGTGAADDLALTLAIRPSEGASDMWLPVEHGTPTAQGGADAAKARATARPLPRLEGGERLGLAWSMRIPADLRQRMVDGDLRQQALWQVRVCAATTAPEAGLAADAKANNCGIAEFVVVRLERPYGVHRYPEPQSAQDLPSSDYFEIGKTETQGNGALRVDRFRGGYREVADGHVRFGGVFWTRAVSSVFSMSSGKFTQIRAYHDTAPLAQDFVSGSIELLGAATIELPKFNVPDSFQFALNAAVDTSASSMKFTGSANLEPLVSALNFIGKQASAVGPKFCVPMPGKLPDICLAAPLVGTIDLMVGVAFAKGIDKPKCQPINGGGCLEVDVDQAGHFWTNAKSCIDRGASLPSNRGQAATVQALHAYANSLGAPFYLGGARPGVDYNYLMSQVFFDKGWQAYASEFATALPTYWAFLDASLLIESGACAVQAPDTYTKAMRVDYGVESVAKASVANPLVLDLASNAHVPCHAQLQRVCEYPVAADGTVQFERNEIFAQLAVQAGLSAKVAASQSLGVSGIGEVSGSVSLTADLLSTTFAATVGQRWTATRRKDGTWETQGSAFGNVGIWGKLGDITIAGEACGTLLFVPAVCFGVTLGGLSKILPLVESNVSFSMDFLPFHVKAGG